MSYSLSRTLKPGSAIALFLMIVAVLLRYGRDLVGWISRHEHILN
jgi:hypothetical protein